MLRSPKRRQLAAALPLDQVLTKTDGSLVEVIGRSVRPTAVAQTVADLAVLRSMPVDRMAGIIIANLRTFVAGRDSGPGR